MSGEDVSAGTRPADVESKDAAAAYARGTQRFMGVELLAEPGALVPRAETELLGRTAVGFLEGIEAPVFIDMCCGSGNLACGIAAALPKLRGFASDLTDGCVTLARKNVLHLKLGGRMEIVQGDLFAPLAPRLEDGTLAGKVDVIVCNPPYISTGRLEKERAELLSNEPREAFDGGPYGLSIHQRVLKEALPYLKSGGVLLFEFGLGQEKQLKILFERVKGDGGARAYGPMELAHDAAGAPRVAYARKT